LLLFPIFTLRLDGRVEARYYYMDGTLKFHAFTPVIKAAEHFSDFVVELERRYADRQRTLTPEERPNALQPGPSADPKSGANTVSKPQWYETPIGRQELAAAVDGLRTKALPFETRTLSDGRLAFVLKGPGLQEVTVICDESHPDSPPTVHVLGAPAWKGSTLSEFISELYEFFSRQRQSDMNILA
jgi:hypothetical protein